MDVNEFVKGINDPRLKDAIRRLANTPDGQKLLSGITPQDKQNLMRQMSGLNASGITNEMLLRQLNNPNIIRQLNSILGKKR